MADLQNEFSWSKSRHEKFDECRRAYFYTYYGSWGGWSAGASGPAAMSNGCAAGAAGFGEGGGFVVGDKARAHFALDPIGLGAVHGHDDNQRRAVLDVLLDHRGRFAVGAVVGGRDATLLRALADARTLATFERARLSAGARDQVDTWVADGWVQETPA